MIDEILSFDDLRELSQFKSLSRIKDWLDDAGVPYLKDRYGRPRVHRIALQAAMGGGYSGGALNDATPEQEPDWSSMR